MIISCVLKSILIIWYIIFSNYFLMDAILKEVQDWKKFELLINTKIFSQEIALQTAYAFLHKGYFFFDLDANDNLILQFTPKKWVNITPEEIIGEFSDELLAMSLRDKLEKENKEIRETIVKKAINGPFDLGNFVSLDTDIPQKDDTKQDFDKDITEILKDIENNPALQVNEEEIEKVLQEIEAESKQKKEKPTMKVDVSALEDVKKSFKK